MAQATPPGPGGIAVVRLSGPTSWKVGRSLFRPAGSDVPWDYPRLLVYGHIVDHETGETIDEVLCAFFKGPRSYSAEDSVEVQCHGGPSVVSRIIGLALANGCRVAGPGEFTLRGMLGGRIDFSRAEAVASLVSARSDAEARTALAILEGGLARQLGDVRDALVDVAASVEAAIDFPEDIGELAGLAQASQLSSYVVKPLQALINGSLARSAYREGATVVICGRPNVGKSSLFNALLGRQRTIVSDLPGTTRDRVDEFVILGGVACRLCDTAGLGLPQGNLDQLGQDAARAILNDADLALVVLDSSEPLQTEDHKVLNETKDLNRLIVRNKRDLSAVGLTVVPESVHEALDISAKFGLGLDELSSAIGRNITHGIEEPGPNDIIVNARQREALERCWRFAFTGFNALKAPDPQVELVSLDLQSALSALGEVDGQGAPDEVIDAVFSKFCVGK